MPLLDSHAVCGRALEAALHAARAALTSVATAALIAVGGASGAVAQGLPSGVVFDDFAYESLEWENTLRGDPDTLSLGPAGSIYGPNPWVVSTDGREATHRMWYRYNFQEPIRMTPERRLSLTPEGLAFTIPPGAHQADACRPPDDPEITVSPQQIVSGFSARRGTWAARVKLGTLPSIDEASMMHAFWLLSPATARVRLPDGSTDKVGSEVDHEWNNWFLGSIQRYTFSSTGGTVGNTTSGQKAPMGTPLAVPPLGIRYDREGDSSVARSWTCRYTRGPDSRTLAPEACAALLEGRRVAGLPAPESEVYTTLLIHIGDDGTWFSLVSDGWGARLEMASDTIRPPTVLPMHTYVSQHLYPPGQRYTCEDRTSLRTTPRFEIDWFLYHESPDLNRDETLALVRAIRREQVSRLSTVDGARLERPTRPLVGYAGRWGKGAWTSPISITVDAPRRMRPGETATVLALPPARGSSYRYMWTLETRYANGRYEVETRDDPFALPLTFPRNARTILVKLRVEELDTEHEVVVNETVRPIEKVFMIGRL